MVGCFVSLSLVLHVSSRDCLSRLTAHLLLGALLEQCWRGYGLSPHLSSSKWSGKGSPAGLSLCRLMENQGGELQRKAI